MSADSEFIERENAFWEGSVEYYKRWLARHVLMVLPAPVGILKRDEVLTGIRSGPRWTSIEMADIIIRRSGSSMVALAYRARARKAGSASDYSALIGSVYVWEDEEWKLAFHQHTPIADEKTA